MANDIMTHSTTAWQLNAEKTLTTQTSTISIKLNTAGKFVDKNIEINNVVSVQPAETFSITGGEVTASVSVSHTLGTKEVAGQGWPLIATATGVGSRASAQATVGTAGWVNATTSLATLAQADSEVSTVTSTYYIPMAVFTTEGNEVVVTAPGYVDTGSVTGGTVETGVVSASTALDSFDTYFEEGSSTVKDVTVTTNKAVTKAGYVNTGMSGTVTTSYYSIKKGSLTNVPSGKAFDDYAELDAPAILTVLPAGDTTTKTGWLYINQGWYEGGKISLDTLIPDEAGLNTPTTMAVAGNLLAGYVAYDDKGERIIGGMPTVATSSDYFTTNESAGIFNSKIGPGYLESAQYVKKGSASVVAATITPEFSNVTANGAVYEVAVTGAKTVTAEATEGWITSVDSADVSVEGTLTLTKAVIDDANVTCTVSASKATEVVPTLVNASGYSNASLVTSPSADKKYIKISATTTMTATVAGSGVAACSTAGWIAAGTQASVAYSTKAGGDVLTSSKDCYLEIFTGDYTIS